MQSLRNEWAAMREPILQTKLLVKRFGGFTPTASVDLNVYKGEIRCLIGPNGAGKSTLLGLLIGRIRPTSGEIVLAGKIISGWPALKRVRAGMAIKFQVPSVFADMTVHDNLAVAHERSAPARHEQLRATLGRLGLSEVAHVKAGHLSHGHKQWLEIGMAMAAEPSLLLLDEPSAGLSPEDTYRTGQLVKELNATGTTVIAVEHDMAFVKQVAHSVTVLHLGRIFFEGTFDEVAADPAVADIYLGRSPK
jgi:branched-chain amino acid transport system ATP-binding protein